MAASIALGNYHNCAPDGSIQCEYVSVDDYANMVRLCLALAGGATKTLFPLKVLRATLEKKAATYDQFFRPLK